jgi:diphosphomevalonate decarboxylase
MRAAAIAHPNIALIKYWGKRDPAFNLPAVGSLSITLDGMSSRTTVEFDARHERDAVYLNGRADPATAAKVTTCLDRVRTLAGRKERAVVRSVNDFPTGAGLASSASGFAALVTAAAAALDLRVPIDQLAEIARLGSGSAPRSLFGGFAMMRNESDGSVSCAPVLGETEWPLEVIIAVTTAAPKEVSSRDGMEQSRLTSPFYGEWVASHAADLSAGTELVARRDFSALAELAEHNCLKMHAVMMTTQPPLIYWSPATLGCIKVIQALRRGGVPVFFTVDAGPQLKAICLPGSRDKVRAALADVAGVSRLIDCRLGGAARLLPAGTTVDG